MVKRNGYQPQSSQKPEGQNLPDGGTLVKSPPIAINEMLASEALYGFVGWLTRLEKPVTASCKHDVAIWAEMIFKFIKIHELTEPRNGWEKRLQTVALLLPSLEKTGNSRLKGEINEAGKGK